MKNKLNSGTIFQIFLITISIIAILSAFLPFAIFHDPVMHGESVSFLSLCTEACGLSEEPQAAEVQPAELPEETITIADIKETMSEESDFAMFTKGKFIHRFIPVGYIAGFLAFILPVFILLSLFFKEQRFTLWGSIVACVSAILFLISILLTNDLLYHMTALSLAEWGEIGLACIDKTVVSPGIGVYVLIGATFCMSVVGLILKNSDRKT